LNLVQNENENENEDKIQHDGEKMKIVSNSLAYFD
jgi:hypothetical protein